MERIGIFCSASNNIPQIFIDKTRELGQWLGKNNKTIIYGGSNQGLMEEIAKAAKQAGKPTLMGIIPTKLEERGRVSDLIDIEFKTANLSDRKDILQNESEIMIALPGGIGTLDEVTHVMAEATIGYHDKKIILYNIEGFWNDIIKFMDTLNAHNFIHRPLSQILLVADTLDELIKFVEE